MHRPDEAVKDIKVDVSDMLAFADELEKELIDGTYEEIKDKALDPTYLASLTDAQYNDLITCLNNQFNRDLERLRDLVAKLVNQ